MARAFAQIGFTPNVRKVQSEMGSRQIYQAFEQGADDFTAIDLTTKNFIAERDSFYMATTNQDGWPYIQHRGGPRGFLKVIGEKTIGFADFSGNRQYLSVGNLHGNNRVCLFLMSYGERRRLKIWGRAQVVEEMDKPSVVAKLEMSDFRASVERGIVINVEAFDWNCPKYITPRYTRDEIEKIFSQEHTKNSRQLKMLPYSGKGSLPMIISAVRQLTKEVRIYELQHAKGADLPGYEAGAHISVPVQLSDGSNSTHAYSLTTIKNRHHFYQIAVKNENTGDGGSHLIHNQWQVGTEINIEAPENFFRLHNDERHTVLVAGGIGITPIKSMAEELEQRGSSFEIHYSAKSRQAMPFYDELSELFPDKVHFYFSQKPHINKLVFSTLFCQAGPDAEYYICGPQLFMRAALQAGAEMGIDRTTIHTENFN